MALQTTGNPLQNLLTIFEDIAFDDVVDAALKGIRAAGSKQQYHYTYQQWARWCAANELHPLNLNMSNVNQYLLDRTNRDGDPVTFQTRQNQLSHLRKLVEVLAIHSPAFKQMYEQLGYMKTPEEGAGDNEREKQLLTEDDVQAILGVWRDDRSKKAARNHLILCLSLATGARISEVSKLKRSHVDLARGTVEIVKGKGSKTRTAVIVDDGIPVRNAFRRLDALLPPDYMYLFVGTRRGGHWSKDKPISRQATDYIVRDTSERSGVAFTHHHIRASLATELVRNGGEAIIKDVLDQFGWESAETMTRNYMIPATAEQRRKNFKTGWGKDQ